MYEYAIGVDLGGTNLRAAAIESSGQMIDRVSASVQYSAGRDVIIAEIVTAIRAVRDTVGASGLRGVGIGVPGYISVGNRSCHGNVESARFRWISVA